MIKKRPCCTMGLSFSFYTCFVQHTKYIDSTFLHFPRRFWSFEILIFPASVCVTIVTIVCYNTPWRYNSKATLKKTLCQRCVMCSKAVSASDNRVVSTLCNVENPKPHFISFSISDPRHFNNPQRWNNVILTLKCRLGLFLKPPKTRDNYSQKSCGLISWFSISLLNYRIFSNKRPLSFKRPSPINAKYDPKTIL